MWQIREIVGVPVALAKNRNVLGSELLASLNPRTSGLATCTAVCESIDVPLNSRMLNGVSIRKTESASITLAGGDENVSDSNAYVH
jgi:hypothetical protein